MDHWKVFIISYVILVWSSSVKASRNGTSTEIKNRIKRDACIEYSVLSALDDFLTKPMAPLAYIKTLIGFASPTPCDLDRKLDQILEKLEEISAQLKDSIECAHITHNHYRSVNDKINHLIRMFKEFLRTPHRRSAQASINEVCMDPTEGVAKIYSEFQSLLSEEDVGALFRSCFRYESPSAINWSKKVTQMANLFIIVLKGCEEASQRKTDFDFSDFIQVFDARIQYYLGDFIRKGFYNGMRESVKSILNDGGSASELGKKLDNLYSFYTWDVILYPDVVRGWDKHAAFYGSSFYCGSYFFMRELKTGRNALIAWCLPGCIIKENNKNIIDGGYQRSEIEHAREIRNFVRDKIPDYNYVLVVITSPKYKDDHYGYFDFKKNEFQVARWGSMDLYHFKYFTTEYKRVWASRELKYIGYNKTTGMQEFGFGGKRQCQRSNNEFSLINFNRRAIFFSDGN